MFCPKCGSKLEDGAVFCNECGARIAEEAAPQAKAPQQPAEPQQPVELQNAPELEKTGGAYQAAPEAKQAPKNVAAKQAKEASGGKKSKAWIPITATVAAVAVIGGGVGGYLYLNSPSKHYEAAMSKGNAALDEKQYKDAIKNYLEAKKIDGSKEDADEALYDAYMAYGKKLAKDENYEDAIEQYDKALEIKEKDKKAIKALNEAYLALANQCVQEGKNDEALTYAKLVLKTDEENSDANYLVWALEGYGSTDPYEPSEPTYASSEPSEVYVPSSSEPEEVSPYPILKDANGNVYDLGGMEIIIRDWWSPWDPAEPQNYYEEQLQEYREWIQETYNFKIKQVGISDWGSVPSDFQKYVEEMGDANNYIFVLRPDGLTAATAWNGYCYDLSTLDCLDFSSKKFTVNKLHKQYTLGNHVYAMYAGYQEPRTGVYFNKRLLQEVTGLSGDDIYDMQKNGTWTWDKFCEICDQIKSSGLCYACNSSAGILSEAAVYANGGEFIGRDSSGGFVYKLEDQKTMEGLNFAQKIYDNYWDKTPAGSAWEAYRQSFIDGNYVFMFDQAYVGQGSLSSMMDDWGFVSFPKPTASSNYVSFWSGNPVVIPACYDADRAWKIAFAWNLYTEDVFGEEDDSWKSSYLPYYCDRRSVDETLAMMRTNGVNAQIDLLNGLEIGISMGPDLTWRIAPGPESVNDVVASISDSWKSAVETANQFMDEWLR